VPTPGDVVITPRVLDQTHASAAELHCRETRSEETRETTGGTHREAGEAGRFVRVRLAATIPECHPVRATRKLLHPNAHARLAALAVRATRRATAEIDERISLAGQRTEALARLVESAEVNITVLAHKSAKAAGRADELNRRDTRSEETRETAQETE